MGGGSHIYGWEGVVGVNSLGGENLDLKKLAVLNYVQLFFHILVTYFFCK